MTKQSAEKVYQDLILAAASMRQLSVEEQVRVMQRFNEAQHKYLSAVNEGVGNTLERVEKNDD